MQKHNHTPLNFRCMYSMSAVAKATLRQKLQMPHYTLKQKCNQAAPNFKCMSAHTAPNFKYHTAHCTAYANI